MAGNTSSSTTAPRWNFDVFVSFGEKDMKENFISNLFKRLHQVGIGHFGEENIECAEKIEATCPNAFCKPTFAFALVVFSKNYVDSTPCLIQLDKILKCKSVHNLGVIPIFYMEREIILNLASSGSLEGHSKALAEAGKIPGCELKTANGERNLIDKIVGRLINDIHSHYSGKIFTFGPFGGEGQNYRKPFETEMIEMISEKVIKVEYGDFIKSVKFGVHENTSIGEEDEDGCRTYEVKLKEKEYITSFAGSKRRTDKNGVLISSLTFRTNKRILGPIGKEKEKEEKKEKKEENEEKEEEEYFSVPLDAGKVTKFFWRRKGNFLECVGALVQLHPENFNPFDSVGLFGRECGQKWEHDRTHTNVTEIVIRFGQKEELRSGGPFIRLIEFSYKDKHEKKTHGSDTGLDKKKKPGIIKLGKDEYLTSISGYYTDDISEHCSDFGITSLTFRTNKRMAMTFGEEKGIYFSSPAMAGKIVRFYGYNNGHQHLHGIGAYFEPTHDLSPNRSIGPSGGSSGDTWVYGKFKGVRKIVVKHCNNNIHHIKFEYADGSVQDYTVTCGGCTAKCRLKDAMVDLKYPREYLTSVSGYMKPPNGSISSLTFYSNKRRFPSGVVEVGTYFWYPLAGSRIIDFYGSKAPDYIGMHVEPIPHLYPFRTVGPPMKGSGGKPWNDGVHTNVRGFRVTTILHGEIYIIQSITFMYDDNGYLVKGDQHGGGDASGEEWVMLDFPKERLLRIDGYMRKEGVQTIIHNLTIVPTGESIPYAHGGLDKKGSTEPPVKFSIPAEDGRIVGFFGTAGNDLLNSIGAWLEPY